MDKLIDIIITDVEKICNKVNLTEVLGKTVLITGASGLIGGYFLASLKKLSCIMPGTFKVIAVMQKEPSSYLMEFLNFNGASVFCGDLTNYEFCQILPKADYIIHSAGYGQPGRFMEDQIKTLQINTLTTFSLFEKLSPQGKFLFISSSEVYSGLVNPPYIESEIGITNTTHPRSCYIEAKCCGEAICNAYRVRGINAKSARLALAYGPGTKKGDLRVINSFIEKAINGKIMLIDEGRAKRTYCYVSDAIEIMWNILLFGKEPIYNVGGVSRTTVADLALLIGKYMSVPVIFPTHSENMVGAPDDVYLDISKAANEFHKTEYVSFEEGLERTIEWQKALYGVTS